MNLRNWRRDNDLTLADFARLINVETRMTVSRYERGMRIPAPDIMKRIRRATNGAVTAADFYTDQAPEPAPAVQATP